MQVERVVWLDPKKEMHSRERRLNKGKEKKRGPIEVGKGQGSSFQEERRGSRDKIRGNRDRELGAN